MMRHHGIRAMGMAAALVLGLCMCAEARAASGSMMKSVRLKVPGAD